jgi:hypothetical protein
VSDELESLESPLVPSVVEDVAVDEESTEESLDPTLSLPETSVEVLPESVTELERLFVTEVVPVVELVSLVDGASESSPHAARVKIKAALRGRPRRRAKLRMAANVTQARSRT